MKWTKTPPKVSGYYWLKPLQRLMDGTVVPGYFIPSVVRVTIDTDPEWPRQVYSCCNYETEFDFKEGDLWSGPIPPPKD